MDAALPQILDRIRSQDFAGAASLAESALAGAPERADLWHLLGIARRQMNRLDGAIQAFERAAEADPARATLHFNLGQAYAAAGRAADAVQRLDRALALDPALVRARFELGAILRAQGDLERAERELRLCLSQADDARVHDALAATLLDRGRPDLALPVLKAGLVLAPENAALHANLGNALRDLGRPLQALPSYDRALALAPQADEIRLNRAHALLRAGRLGEGFQAYEVRLKRPRMVRRGLLDIPQWDGSALAGRTLLVHSEQGHGDSIQFVRYAALARQAGGRVVVECQDRLHRLFEGQSDSLADAIRTRDQAPPQCDLRASLMSLPALLKTELATVPAAVPYLRPVAGIQFPLPPARSGSRLRIGLVWSGNPSHHQDRMRSCPLPALAPLLALGDVTVYPLQLDIADADRALLATHHSVVPLDRPQADFADAAAAMAQLDLVVSVDTAAAHLAGALGLPCIVLLAVGADWRWMVDRADSPWYPTLTLLRQKRPGDWASVARSLVERLRAAPARSAA